MVSAGQSTAPGGSAREIPAIPRLLRLPSGRLICAIARGSPRGIQQLIINTSGSSKTSPPKIRHRQPQDFQSQRITTSPNETSPHPGAVSRARPSLPSTSPRTGSLLGRMGRKRCQIRLAKKTNQGSVPHPDPCGNHCDCWWRLRFDLSEERLCPPPLTRAVKILRVLL